MRRCTSSSPALARLSLGSLGIAATARRKTDEEIAEDLALPTPTVKKDRDRLARLLLAGGPAGGACGFCAGAPIFGGEGWRSDSCEPLANPRAHISLLTPRELAVARLLANGLQTKEIAAKLGTSPATVHKQTMAVYAKLRVSGRTAAAVFMARFDGPPDRTA